MKIYLLLSFLFLAQVAAFSQRKQRREKVGETTEVTNKNIDWEAYDSSSVSKQNNITIQDLQGLWKAYNGVYRFGEYVNEMHLTTPFIIEVKENTFRQNPESGFKIFYLTQNMLISKSTSGNDTGIINKLTPAGLTISWKNNSNYTRYYYTK